MRGNLNCVTITHNSVLKFKKFCALYIHSCYTQVKTPNNPKQIQETMTNHVSCKMFIKKYFTLQYSTLIRYTDQAVKENSIKIKAHGMSINLYSLAMLSLGIVNLKTCGMAD